MVRKYISRGPGKPDTLPPTIQPTPKKLTLPQSPALRLFLRPTDPVLVAVLLLNGRTAVCCLIDAHSANDGQG